MSEPELKQVRVNGTDFAYIEQGSGDAVLFVHGTCTDWRLWDIFRPAVAARYRFISYSRRYHRPNRWPDDGSLYSCQQHCADLVTFIQTLCPQPIHVVGLSYGALLVVRAAIERPELFRSVCAYDPPLSDLLADWPGGRAVLDERARAFVSMRDTLLDGRVTDAIQMAYDWFEGEVGAFGRISPQLRQCILDNADTFRPQLLQPLPPPVTSCGTLAAVKVPVLAMTGERSPPYFALVHSAMAHCLPPGSAAKVIGGNSHVPLSTPRTFIDAVLAFVAAH